MRTITIGVLLGAAAGLSASLAVLTSGATGAGVPVGGSTAPVASGFAAVGALGVVGWGVGEFELDEDAAASSAGALSTAGDGGGGAGQATSAVPGGPAGSVHAEGSGTAKAGPGLASGLAFEAAGADLTGGV